MRRLIVQPGAVTDNRIHITDKDDIMYLSGVLRMKAGDKLLVSDGAGRSWETGITEISRSGIDLEILSENHIYEDMKTKVTLYQALPKGSKMEEIIRKSTEIGVYKIVPVVTKRTLEGSKNTTALRRERWLRVAKEASRQSRRLIVPELSTVLSFEEAAAGLKDAGFDLILAPYELEEERTLKQALRESIASVDAAMLCRAQGVDEKPLSIAVFIGPEGGFESEEIVRLVSEGAISVTLGDTILRTETAGPATVAMILYEFS